MMETQCGCEACRAQALARDPEAQARAEGLLQQHLTPEQADDWRASRAFNVRGSNGSLFRLTASERGSHSSVVREEYLLPDPAFSLGVAVWPVGLQIEADWALSMLLYLRANETEVVNSGCHGRMMKANITDYGGKL